MFEENGTNIQLRIEKLFRSPPLTTHDDQTVSVGAAS